MTQTNSQIARPPRRVYVDAMKGLGILLVVWGHFEEYYRGTSPLFNGTFECMYLFHMALFCLCSGLVAKLNLKKWFGQQLWLYLVSQAVMLAFRAVVMREDLAQAQGGAWGAFLLPWRQMWYLYALLFWELTVPFLRFLRQKLGLAGGLLGLAAALTVGLLAGRVEWPFALNRVFAFYPFFAAGVLFRSEVDGWSDRAQKRPVLRWAAGLGVAVGYGFRFWQIWRLPEPVYEGARIFQDAAYQAGFAMADRAVFYLVGLATSLALIGLLGQCRALADLGRRTLAVYVLHMPVLAFLIELGTYAPPNDKGTLAVAGWVAVTAGGTLCLLASRPVTAAFTAAADLWYKTLPALLQRGAQDRSTRA